LALVRPSLLLIIACAELLVIGGMVILIRHLQRERSSLTTELNHDSDLEYIGTKILIRSVLHARVR